MSAVIKLSFSSVNSEHEPSYGCHFCCTVHTFTNIKALITNGILHLGELANEPEELFTTE